MTRWRIPIVASLVVGVSGCQGTGAGLCEDPEGTYHAAVRWTDGDCRGTATSLTMVIGAPADGFNWSAVVPELSANGIARSTVGPEGCDWIELLLGVGDPGIDHYQIEIDVTDDHLDGGAGYRSIQSTDSDQICVSSFDLSDVTAD